MTATVMFTCLLIGIVAIVLVSIAASRLGERAKERDAIGLEFTLKSTIDDQPLDIDQALHRVPSIYRRRPS